jgi:hypothetical protein
MCMEDAASDLTLIRGLSGLAFSGHRFSGFYAALLFVM